MNHKSKRSIFKCDQENPEHDEVRHGWNKSERGMKKEKKKKLKKGQKRKQKLLGKAGHKRERARVTGGHLYPSSATSA